MMRAIIRWGLVLAGILGSVRATAQTGPTPEPSSLGAAPGEGGLAGGSAVNDSPLGGAPGAGTPRVPSSVSRPGGEAFGLPAPSGIGSVDEAPRAELPLYGALSLPVGAEDEGPPTGLTLDMAIERLVRANLDLRAKSLEIPQAQADVLTAGLRANPILFADAQLIPVYQEFSEDRPGGSTQYDINVTIPLDLNRKRRARVDSACRARRVLEAQYQDAVRQTIANLATAYVDVLAARETVRYARSSIEGLGRLQRATQALRQQGEATAADLTRVEIQRDSAEIGLEESEEALRQAKRALAPLLNLPPARAEALELRGTIHDRAGPAPPGGTLVRIALEGRPDLVAARLGIARAEADVRLGEAERFQDVFLLVQPYTFQDNSPFDRKSAHSAAVGVTVPLPLFNRNQGNIQRARINVAQSRTELAQLEQAVETEVLQAERRYAVSRNAVGRIERDLLPAASRVRDDALKLYQAGEEDIVVYLNAQREYNDLVRQYRDTLIRHRRSMLELNTTVGRRLLP